MFRRLLSIICLLICVSIISIYFASPALALTVGYSGGKGLNPEVSPGESYTQKLLISVNKKEPATDVLIEVLGYRDGDNGVEPVPVDEDDSPYSGRTFIEPGRLTVHCEPGETAEAEVTVAVPSNISAGGYYAVLRFSTVPEEGSTIGIVSAIILPVRFTVNGGQLVHTGEISAVTTGEAVSGQPVDIYTAFKNTGNHHFNIKGQVEIRNPDNKLLDILFINSSSPAPEEMKNIKTTFIPEESLEPGIYNIKSRLNLEDGTLLGEAAGSFEIKTAYVPPPPPAAAVLKPSTSNTLKTFSGGISIDFPQGAVTSQAEVSLQSYPVAQLPAPPQGYQPAATCFRVDGLNGLLAKPATVSVKYSSTDLAKAGGNASRLVLARWDEATSRWSVLPTQVNRGNLTLTASTNQFSLWAVMVGQPAAAVNWSLIGALIGAALLVLAGLLLVIIRRKR